MSEVAGQTIVDPWGRGSPTTAPTGSPVYVFTSKHRGRLPLLVDERSGESGASVHLTLLNTYAF